MQRIIYLGGLGDPAAHLRSCHETGNALRESGCAGDRISSFAVESMGYSGEWACVEAKELDYVSARCWIFGALTPSDNTALYHACNQPEEIVPVYILSNWKKHHPWTGSNRQEFLCGCLESLSQNLKAPGGQLILRAGHPVKELEKLVHETCAQAIFFSRGTDPYSLEIQQQLEKVSAKLLIRIFSYKDVTIFEPNAVLTKGGGPFRFFTPYAKAWHLGD